ncbi:HipA domain-containing protein [Humitalea sp. 24SJ18S-53]|uniref:HipA domain-containing protein n=1 Tax=Humitalea sp. 24SJ18S-53 TaxID=3422307 RepID=UPI003D6656BB
MSAAPVFIQPAGHVLDISDWDEDEDYPINPIGQKPKQHFICPIVPPKNYLIGGRRYMFKTPVGRSVQQVWSEVIAYQLAQHAGIVVPPAYIAKHNFRKHGCGVLIEFFLGPTHDPGVSLLHASDRFQARNITFDEKQGSLRENVILTKQHGIVSGATWWARTIVFDALIGNTDRHSQNWGFLKRRSVGSQVVYEMAPVFDNGSSLGSVVRDSDLESHMRPERFQKFVDKGRHHFSWLQMDGASRQFARLPGFYATKFPSLRPAMLEVARISDDQIDTILRWCVEFTFPISFTPARAEFVSRLLRARRDSLLTELRC